MLAELLAKPFQAASRLRRDRCLHPRGRTYAATLRTDLLGEPRDHEVAVRVSKSIPTPGGLPDVLGIAVRIPAGDGQVDLLFATTGSRPVLRHLLCPRASFTAVHSTLLPYDVKGQTRTLALLPASGRTVPARIDDLDAAVADSPLLFTLATARPDGPWEPCGTLEIRTLAAEVDAFDPQVNNVPGLRPTGPFQRFRTAAYRSSRQGRDQPTPTAGRVSR